MADRKITALDPVEATDLSNDNTLIQFVNPDRVLEIDRNRRGTLADVASGVLRRSPDGTAALPALRFVSDPNTGVYRVGADSLGFSAGGALRAAVSTSAVELEVPVRVQDGSAAAPSVSFADDTNTGLFRVLADVLGMSAGGTVRAKIANAAPYLTVNDGTSDQEVWHDGNVTVTTNANGTSMRFPIGIQVCWQRTAPSIAVDSSSTKGGFLSAEQTWTFPQAFSADPFLFCSIEATAGVAGNMERFSTSSARWRIRAITSQVATSTPIYLLAIGAWG